MLNPGDTLPAPNEVSAVFLVALQKEHIVTIHNHRGWDLPAGHREEGEGLLQTLAREVREEASMVFTNAIPFVVVTSDSENLKYKGKYMVGFVTKEFTLNEFVPAPDSTERKKMSINEFVSLYEGDKAFMKMIIEAAQRKFENSFT